MKTETIQKIYELVALGFDSDWQSIQFHYKADESQSEHYGVAQHSDGEKYFRPQELESSDRAKLRELLRAFREEAAELGGESFTHCILSFTADGDFKIKQSYDPIDWSVQSG